MPRVPLQKLKEQQKNDQKNDPQHNHDGVDNFNDVDNCNNVENHKDADNHNDVEEPTSKCTSLLQTLKRKITETCWRKQNVTGVPVEENIQEDIESVQNEETQMDNTLLAAARPLNVQDRGTDVEMQPITVSREQTITETRMKQVKEPLHIQEDTIKAMKDMEVRLKKENRGRKLRVVVVESESEDENGAIQDCPFTEKGNNHWGLAENASFTESGKNQDSPFVVQAEIHQENSVKIKRKDNGEKRARADHEGQMDDFEAGIFAGARPKINVGDFAEDKVQEVREQSPRKQTKMKVKEIKRPQRKKQQDAEPEKHNEVNWGFDESSESDGSWDLYEGDIPLLPREPKYEV